MTGVAGLVLSMSAWGGQWSIKDNEYVADTLYHGQIGPGTTQTSVALKGSLTLQVFYTTIDLSNPYVDVRVVKAGDVFSSVQTPENQGKSKDRAGARYFAGVNGDFFANSAPCGSTVSDGVVYNTINNAWSAWYMTADKQPHTGDLGYKGTCFFPDGSAHAITINGSRGEDGLVIYNSRYNGSNTGTNKYGREVSLELVGGALEFSGDSRYRVTSNPVSAGSMAIPAGGYVLSGHCANGSPDNYAGWLVDNLKIGDEISLELYPGLGEAAVTQLISGLPVILEKGQVLDNEWRDATLLSARHPRTAVGHSADGKKVVLMIVDGRSNISQGVTSTELAHIMKCAGCDYAMNLDGGGSSALYTTAFGYRNNISDGTPRPVTNSVWAVSTAPDDNVVAKMMFTDPIIRLPKYGKYAPVIYSYNQYGVLLNTDYKDYTLSCPAELGSVSADGKTLFVTGTGTHTLTAKSGNVSVTVPVVIGDGEPSFRLTDVVVDGYRDYETEVVGTVGELTMPLDNQALVWSSDNEAVATVDEHGVIHGVSNGTATVTGRIESAESKLNVTVQRPGSRYVGVDPAGATLTKTSVKNESITIGEDGKSFDVGVTISSARAPKITVNLKKDMYALPDSIGVDFTPSDVTVSSVTFSLTGNGGRAVVANVDGPFAADAVNTAKLPLSDFIDTEDFANYPVAINSVAFALSGTTNDAGVIAVKSVYGVHAAVENGAGGVDDVVYDANNNGNAEYYDLQGRRIPENNAVHGVVIRKQGSETQKIVK